MFIIGRSLTGGVRSGLAAAVGISIGSVCHTLAAALGLSLILATSALAFTIVKLMGAAYLLYLGLRLLLTRTSHGDVRAVAPTAGARSAFFQGILTNVLNPKVALFFLAFLPQFIDPRSHGRTLAFMALGTTFIMTGLLWCVVLAFGAARLQAFFARNPSVRTLLDRAVGLPVHRYRRPPGLVAIAAEPAPRRYDRRHAAIQLTKARLEATMQARARLPPLIGVLLALGQAVHEPCGFQAPRGRGRRRHRAGGRPPALPRRPLDRVRAGTAQPQGSSIRQVAGPH